MKKIRSIAVMLILTVILAQLPLLSASTDTYGDYSYKILSDGTAEITGYSGSDTCLTIPNEINGYTVTSIGDSAFSDCTSLKSIIIPDSVTSIQNCAFCFCNNLHTVVFTGSKKDWDNLFIDVGNDSLYNANITFAPRGDVNGDEKIDASDLLIIQNMMLGYNEPSKKADINGDGFITADDLLMVQFIILGF